MHFEVCHSGNLPPIEWYALAEADCSTSVQQHAGSGSGRCADPEMLRPHHSADPDHRSAYWRHSELGAQSGRKNPPACFVCYVVSPSKVCCIKLCLVVILLYLGHV